MTIDRYAAQQVGGQGGNFGSFGGQGGFGGQGFGGQGGFNGGRPRGVCFDWQKGECTRGDNCRFAHDDGGAQQQAGFVGGFGGGGGGFGGGFGGGGLVAFAGGPVCPLDYAMAQGGGMGGGSQRFGGRPRGVCFDFQKGRCTRGENCRFSHEQEGGQGGFAPQPPQGGQGGYGQAGGFAGDFGGGQGFAQQSQGFVAGAGGGMINMGGMGGNAYAYGAAGVGGW